MLKCIYVIIAKENREEFLHRPGFQELEEDCRKQNWQIKLFFKRDFTVAAAGFTGTGGILNPETEGSGRTVAGEKTEEEGLLILTDSEYVALDWSRRQVLVIAVQGNGTTSFFTGASVVLTSFLGIDSAFLQDSYLRFHGLPVSICRTVRLHIRESVPEDFQELFEMRQNSGDYCSSDDMESDLIQARDAFLAYIRYQYPFFGFGLWTVETVGGEIIGRCGLCPVAGEEDGNPRIELGYMIKKEERRKGYGLEACTAVLEYAENALELDTIYVCIHKKNQASRCLAGKLGFKIISYPVPDSRYQMYRRSLT